jgi:hypothetical protein
MKQQKLLVVLGLSFGIFLYLLRRGPTSFERRLLKEFEESLIVLVKRSFCSFKILPSY